jgi:hypothetical protein
MLTSSTWSVEIWRFENRGGIVGHILSCSGSLPNDTSDDTCVVIVEEFIERIHDASLNLRKGNGGEHLVSCR